MSAAQPRGLGRWMARVPLVAVLCAYRRGDLPHDFTAGLVLGMVTVPQAVAYAFLAGLPAQAGLYASLLPMVVYAVFGSSRQLVVGPVAIAALMVAATIGEHAPAHGARHLDVAIALSLQVGAFLVLLRLARMGGIANLLSHPVLAGFVNAAAILIVVSQLPAFAGVDAPEHGPAGPRLWALAKTLPAANVAALTIGLGSLAVLWGVRRYASAMTGRTRDHPLSRCGPLLVAVLATIGVVALDVDVETVGVVPAGLPQFAFPAFDAALWWDLAPNAALIALVVYVESFAVGKALAAKRHERIDGNQELLALGAANMSAAFTGAYPVAGSFSRSSVNQAAGGRTPVSGLVCALVIVATLLWLTPLFEHLPRAALAAVVIASVWGLADFRSLRQHWRFHRADTVAHVATLGGVLAVGVEAGLLIGVAVSLALFLRRSSDPHIAVLGRLRDTPHFRNVRRYAVQTWPHLLVVRVDESLYFGNADQVETRIETLAREESALRHLVLAMSAANFVDASGLEMLRRLALHLARSEVALHLCEVKGPVRDQLEHADMAAWLSGRVFRTVDDAVNDLTGEKGSWVWHPAPP